MSGNFDSAKVAKVVIFKVAKVPENMYDSTLPFDSVISNPENDIYSTSFFWTTDAA